MTELKTPTLDRIQLFGKHWQTKAVEFWIILIGMTIWSLNVILFHIARAVVGVICCLPRTN